MPPCARLTQYLHRSLVSLSLPQNIPKLLQRAPVELRLFPQIWRQEAISVAYRRKCSLQCVLECFCRARGRGINILNTGKL